MPALPRPNSRGLIEASYHPRALRKTLGTFHGLTAVASLKLGALLVEDLLVLPFHGLTAVASLKR